MTHATKQADSTLVVVFPRGQLAQKDKERLTKHGIVAVEADDPNAVRMLLCEMPPMPANALTEAAISALASYAPQSSSGLISGAGLQQSKFVSLLAASLKKAKTP